MSPLFKRALAPVASTGSPGRCRRRVVAAAAMGLASMFAATALAGSATAAEKVTSASRTPILTVADQMKAAPGGTQISPNEVSYDGGSVIVSLPVSDDSSATGRAALGDKNASGAAAVSAKVKDKNQKCPSRWYCMYQHNDFNGGEAGRMLRWNLKHCKAGINLDNYGFRDQISSWKNNSKYRVIAKDYAANGSMKLSTLWKEAPHSKGRYVGDENNDRADRVFAC